MTRSILLWVAAFLVMGASLVYQRMTGPTYPLSGTTDVFGTPVAYTFERSHGGDDDHRVSLAAPAGVTRAELHWKRYKTNDAWTVVPMESDGKNFSGSLPHQPPAGKLMYRVLFFRDAASAAVPPGEPVVIRFKGDVPLPILLTHVALMFLGMLFSTRAGIECLRKEPNLKTLAVWSAGMLTVGGLILGPIVQKYAFGAYWTGWPFGHDLTDNKTALIAVSWILTVLAVRSNRHPRRWALVAAIITLTVYLVPHSVLGSEIDYSKEGTEQTTTR